MPSFFASSKSGCVSFEGMLFSKYLASTSCCSSIHQRGKNVVKASSGNTTNFAPMPRASFNKFLNLETAVARESALLSGPSWAAAILRCLAMALSDEFSQLACRAVDGVRGSHGARLAARENLPRAARRLQLAALHHDAPAARHQLRPALVDMALVGRGAGRVLHHRAVDALFDFGIPDGEVGIRSDRDRALARVQAVHA